MSNLPLEWFGRSSLVVAPELLGCTLVRQFPDGTQIRGTIVETEAYAPDDPACHAYRRPTPRNQVMFGPPGWAYVYLIYGMYHCFNAVTDIEGVASAVLVRALQLQPFAPGLSSNLAELDPNSQAFQRLAAGPGKLCQVLQIDRQLTNRPLEQGQPLWIEPRLPEFQQAFELGQIPIVQTTRIGLTVGVDLPWRWYLQGSAAVSKR